MDTNQNIYEHPTITEIARRVAKSTCQLYTYHPEKIGVPQAHGCCVLLQFNNNFYCISNAHVLGDYMGRAFVFTSKNNANEGGKSRIATIGGHYHSTKLPPNGKREDDPLDMTVVKLTKESAEDLKNRGYIFLDIDEIKTGYSPVAGDRLLVVGYPATKTKVNTFMKTVIAKPLYLITNPFLKKFMPQYFPEEFHTIVKYSKGKIYNPNSGKTNAGPLPHGISGSGLWYIGKDEHNNPKPFLVSIFSEYFQKNGLLISTKVDLFIDLIKKTTDPTIPNNGVSIKILE